MFNPRYTITDKLLANIKRINALIIELNHKNFPKTVLFELEKSARAISTYASTSIEGNPLPLTEVKKILKNIPQNLRASEREVINYNEALEQLNQKIITGKIRFNLDFILHIHKQITQKLVPEYNCGKLRESSVFVNNPATGKTIYWPPDFPEVPLLMEKLADYVNRNEGVTDSLIVAGIFHKQFVIIHPFMDGNGRTARLVTKALLAKMGLNTFNLFSFENYHNKNISSYFHYVGVKGNYYDIENKIDFTGWLEYFTDGIIDELLRVKNELSRVAISPDTVLKPYHQQILDYIKEYGYITDKDYAGICRRAKATRTLDFSKLIDLGIIIRLGKGKATYYKIKDLI